MLYWLHRMCPIAKETVFTFECRRKGSTSRERAAGFRTDIPSNQYRDLLISNSSAFSDILT